MKRGQNKSLSYCKYFSKNYWELKSTIFLKKNRRGQVWIETVIYTLIAFVMIGLVLSFAKPKIEELQDRAILQQSTEMMKQIDVTILTMGAAGNQRISEIGIKEGDLKIDGINDIIVFELQSQSVYSEPGKKINDGAIEILTEKRSGYNLVSLTRDYHKDYDLKVEGKDEMKIISSSSTSYDLTIRNEGAGDDRRIVLNISLN